MTIHEYRTGAWIAIVTDGAVALLHPDLGVAAARELWHVTRTGSRLGTWIEQLAERGIRTMPAFAMVEARADGLGILVRGDLVVQVGADSVNGAGYATWREAVLPGDDFTIAPGAGDSTGSDQPAASVEAARPEGGALDAIWLPVGAGIALASGVRSVADDAEHAPRAGLRIAEPASEEEEEGEDLELTLMQAPALAAAMGRSGGPRPPEPGPVAAQHAEPLHSPLDVTRAPEREEELTRPPEDDLTTGTATAAASGVISEVPWARPRPPAPRAAAPARPDAGSPAPGPATDGAPPARPTAPGEPPAADPFAVEGSAPATPAPTTPAEPAPSWDEGDHDGETVMPSDLPGRQATSGPPQATEEPAPTGPRLELLMSDGTRMDISQPLLLGRAPESARFRGAEVPRLVTITNPERDISGTHVEVRPAGEHVVVTDMNSTNGTVVFLPGQQSFRLPPGSGVPVPPGGVIEIGTGVTATVMATGEHGT